MAESVLQQLWLLNIGKGVWFTVNDMNQFYDYNSNLNRIKTLETLTATIKCKYQSDK